MQKTKPTLYIFSGLPACGKTTLAEKLSRHTGAIFLRIDTIEQALRDLCSLKVQGEGYGLSYKIAEDNLRLGINVVADSCNPITLTREAWQGVAKSCGANFENIEIVCSDASVHRERVESRTSTVPHLQLPTWPEVVCREYHAWKGHRHIIDTANRTIEACFKELLDKLGYGMES